MCSRPDVHARLRAALLLFVLVAAATPAAAQPFGRTGRETLRGLPGIEVIVEAIQPEVEAASVTREATRAEVVKRLVASRITVYGSQAENPSPGKPYLYVHINAARRARGGDYAIAVQLQVRQTLRSLVTGTEIVDAMTWDAHGVLITANAADARAELLQYVDRFVRDWLAVH